MYVLYISSNIINNNNAITIIIRGKIMLKIFKTCSGLMCIYASTSIMCYFVGLMNDVKLADRMRNLRKSADNYARKSSKTPKDFALKLVPVTEQEVFGFF